MKKYILVVITIIVSILLTSCVTATHLYEQYIKTSEELLWELEELCEQHDIPWGDTVCEGDNWSNYIEARHNLGLGNLKYYKDGRSN